MTRKTRKQQKDTMFNAFYRHQLQHSEHPRKFTIKQSGRAIITIGEKRFTYYEDKTNQMFLIHGGGDKEDPCFSIEIVEKDDLKYAIISQIIQRTSCSLDDPVESEDIVRAAVELSKIYKAMWVEIVDDSGICKKDYGFSVHLSDYYMLTRGNTWYETIYTFQPDNKDEIEDAKNQVTNISWKEVVANGKRRYKQRFDPILSEINTDGINITARGSAMAVLRTVPYSSRCLFYNNYMSMLLNSFHIQSLFSSKWFLPITQSPPPRILEKRTSELKIIKMNATAKAKTNA
jgi:hypothetical protein